MTTVQQLKEFYENNTFWAHKRRMKNDILLCINDNIHCEKLAEWITEAFHLCSAVSPPKEPTSEQEPCVLGGGVGSEEQQRDSVSPHSADSPMSISSPQQHSSASSVSSLSGSDNVRKHKDNQIGAHC